ncbi:MAG: threonine synthase, partial [Candidatus Wolframiiraptor sp.]
GFRELKLLGLTERIPNMIGVQALGASPVYKAFIEGSDKIKPMESVETVATAIRIGNPVNWKRALRAARETGGMIGAVTDEEILWAQSILASREGVFAEPAGAAPIAFLIKAAREGLIEPDSRVVCIVTGHGLKDPDVVLRRIEKPVEVEPEVDSVLENLSATITEQT